MFGTDFNSHWILQNLVFYIMGYTVRHLYNENDFILNNIEVLSMK